MLTYVLDSSALFALRGEEKGANQVEEILRKGLNKKADLFLSFISITEIFYIVWQRSGEEEAYRVYLQLKMLPLQRVDPNEEILLLAGELKALYPISLADSLIAATAIHKNAILVHKDPEYDCLKGRLEFLPLPYKK